MNYNGGEGVLKKHGKVQICNWRVIGVIGSTHNTTVRSRLHKYFFPVSVRTLELEAYIDLASAAILEINSTYVRLILNVE